jgi:hypothetical protein
VWIFYFVFQEYEIREYAPSVWAVTRYAANTTRARYSSTNTAFMTLFQYISGENVDGECNAWRRV